MRLVTKTHLDLISGVTTLLILRLVIIEKTIKHVPMRTRMIDMLCRLKVFMAFHVKLKKMETICAGLKVKAFR
jgi:hypothetical protein